MPKGHVNHENYKGKERRTGNGIWLRILLGLLIPVLMLISSYSWLQFQCKANEDDIEIISDDVSSAQDRVLTLETEVPLKLNAIHQTIEAVKKDQTQFMVRQEAFNEKLIDKLDRILLP